MHKVGEPPAVWGTTDVTADLYFCESLQHQTISKVVDKILSLVKCLGLSTRNVFTETWENGAVLVTIVLEESHIIFTTYPEKAEGYFVQLDVVLCNFLKNNYTLTIKLFDRVIEIFKPEFIDHRLITRRGPKPKLVLKGRSKSKRGVKDQALLMGLWSEYANRWMLSCNRTIM